MTDPHIEISNITDTINNGKSDLVNRYDMDSGPLALPAKIDIGKKSWDGHLIQNYTEQVGEYDVWLEDQLAKQNQTVMEELERIFTMSLGAGVILTTHRHPIHGTTHAHIVKRVIMDLAAAE